MNVILCFGEILLRFSPDVYGNWLANNNVTLFVGGAEANVAAALAKWEMPVQYCSAFPENYLSQQMIEYLQQKKIDTSKIIFHGNRIGSYYLPEDADLKHQSVIYDRSNSAFAQLEPGTIDWNKILHGVNWFHFSAISPALSQNAAKICQEALAVATEKKIKVSVDLNYRSKLWQYGKQPNEIMPRLVEHCDVVMGNVWSAAKMLNAPIDENLNEKNKKEFYIHQSEQTALYILKNYPRCKSVANTFRFEEEKELNYYATLFTENKLFVSKEYSSNKIIDKVGSGDCFMAGLIYGFSHNLDKQDILEFATAAAFEKLFVRGDFTNKTVAEIEAAIKK
jgi:2-dehydro-3-deoxygluconokinase